MLALKQEKLAISEVKMQILDTSLVVASVIGSLAYFISLYRWILYGFHISFIINLFVISSIIVITAIRKRLSTTLKTYVIIAVLMLLALADALFLEHIGFHGPRASLGVYGFRPGLNDEQTAGTDGLAIAIGQAGR